MLSIVIGNRVYFDCFHSADTEDDFDFGAGTSGGTFGQPKRAQVGSPLSLEEARDCRALVVGKGSLNDSWMQGLYWTEEESLRFGLWQEKGGPCGVIAAAQAFVLAHLLYDRPCDSVQESHLSPSDQERDDALVQAIASILWQAGQKKRAVVILRKGGAVCTSKTFESGLLKFNFTDKVSLIDFLTVRCPIYTSVRFFVF